VGRKGFIVDKVEDLTPAQLVAQILEQHYADTPLGVPPLVLVPEAPDEAETVEQWLAVVRSSGADGGGALSDVEWWAASDRYRVERSVNPTARAGARVEVRVPQRGDKRALLDMVTRNAGEEFTRHRLKRAADHNARARALNALQDALDLPEAPLRIECYDMSHLQGTDYVGSMVVMEDGLPRPQEYRRFKIRTVEQNDDFAAMEEVLTRRLRAYLVERDKPVEERRRRFAYPPQLLLVDGGQGQLNVALRVLTELGLEEEIPAAGLAKQFEEIYLPGRADPLRIPRTSEALYLLQQIRDEAHRFAITYHRKLRGKRMTASVLDDIPGLGPGRKKRLVREVGGVNAVKAASLEELQALSWLPNRVAESVYEKLHG
jgi:excinuclease ABC subunit C